MIKTFAIGVGGITAMAFFAYLTRKWWLPLISSSSEAEKDNNTNLYPYIKKEAIQKLSYEYIVKNVENAILEGNFKGGNNGKATLMVMPNKNALEYYYLAESHGQPFFIKDKMTDDEKNKMVVVLITNSDDMSDIMWGRVYVPEELTDDYHDFIKEDEIYTKAISWDINDVKSRVENNKEVNGIITETYKNYSIKAFDELTAETLKNEQIHIEKVNLNDSPEGDMTLSEILPLYHLLRQSCETDGSTDALANACNDSIWVVDSKFTIEEHLVDYVADVADNNPNFILQAVYITETKTLLEFIQSQEAQGDIKEEETFIKVKERLKSSLQNGECLFSCKAKDSQGNDIILGSKFVKAVQGFEDSIQEALDKGMIYEKKIVME